MFPPHVMLEGVESLPTLPSTVTRLADLIKDKKATTEDFEEAVRLDPVLTANLIHAANNFITDEAKKINTIRDAVDAVGIKRLFDVAIGTSLRGTLPDRLPGYGITSRKFWIHCIAVATIAEALAHKIKMPSADMAFSTGLMHDIGQLVIGGFFAYMMPESNWWIFNTPAEERTLLGCNHCDIGQEIAKKWGLPIPMKETSRWHHELDKIPASADRGLITVIHAADALASSIGFPGVGYKGELLDPIALELIGLSENELMELARGLTRTIGDNAVASGMGSVED